MLHLCSVKSNQNKVPELVFPSFQIAAHGDTGCVSLHWEIFDLQH